MSYGSRDVSVCRNNPTRAAGNRDWELSWGFPLFWKEWVMNMSTTNRYIFETVQPLPDLQRSAQEMPLEPMLLGLADNESPLDADCDDWSLPMSDEDEKANVPPEIERATSDPTKEATLSA